MIKVLETKNGVKSMTIENAILESLIQDGRTIELINSYLLNCCDISISLEKLKESIIMLHKLDLIKVAFPPQYANTLYLQDSLLNDYWFELSDTGEKECIKRNIIIDG